MFHTLLGNPQAISGTTIELTVENDARNLDLWAWIEGELGGSETTYSIFNITIGDGVIIGSNSTSSPAFTTGSGWPAGAVLTITNNGTIVGAGGDGGDSGGQNGGSGGGAIKFTLDATLTNEALVAGGGGGGGGATSSYGGGGGAGSRSGSGGDGDVEPGGVGRLSQGGYALGSAGSGGDLDEAGENDVSGGGTGGAAGYAVDKDGNTVTINGSVSITGTILA
jgi:hypothetical protein